MATADQRLHMLALMDWLCAHEPEIGYFSGPGARPMLTAGLFEQQLARLFGGSGGREVIKPDCSEMCTMICRMAGLADPNGNAYNGYGNTNTMYGHLPHYSDAAAAGVGALIIYGEVGATQHVNMVRDPGQDPMLFNHGSERGPIRLRLSEYVGATGQHVLGFLSIAGL